MRILYSPKFARQYKKLSLVLQREAEKKETLFRQNPFDSRLKTHKLSGALEGFYAFSISNTHRIIFDFAESDSHTARFYQVGTHDLYR